MEANGAASRLAHLSLDPDERGRNMILFGKPPGGFTESNLRDSNDSINQLLQEL